MNKLITLFTLVATLGFAGITNDLANARAIWDSTNYVTAIEAYQTILTTYPDASDEDLAETRKALGNVYLNTHTPARALTEFQTAIDNYPEVSPNLKDGLQYDKAVSLYYLNRREEAYPLFKQLALEPNTPYGWLHNSSYSWYLQVGKHLGRPVTTEDALGLAKLGDSPALRAGVVDFSTVLAPEDYIQYLTRVLMVVPATEENAEFLGRVKSQLEVLK